MSSAREPPSPVVIDPLVAQAVDDLVAAVDRTHCGVVVHGCALTLTAGASMIDNGPLQMYEQIDIGGVVLALGDAITLLPGGKPIMFFGAFVKDDNVFIAGVVPGHEANVSFEPLHAPAQLARLSEADATKVVGKVDKAKAGTAISKLKQQGFVNKKIARLTPPQRASSRVKPEPKTFAPAPQRASSRVKPQPKKGAAPKKAASKKKPAAKKVVKKKKAVRPKQDAATRRKGNAAASHKYKQKLADEKEQWKQELEKEMLEKENRRVTNVQPLACAGMMPAQAPGMMSGQALGMPDNLSP